MILKESPEVAADQRQPTTSEVGGASNRSRSVGLLVIEGCGMR
jgi:hypothetical protein